MRLVYMSSSLRCLGKTIVNLCAKIAGRASVKLLLGHTTLLVIANDLKLVHVVRLLGEERLCLMLEHPPGGLPDVLVHGGRGGTNHPATAITMANMRANLLGRLRIPELIPSLLVEVTHDLLILGAVARHNVTVWIDKERVERHVARQ